MLRRIRASRGGFGSSENAAVERLVTAHGQLRWDGDRIEVKTEAGYAACAAMLGCIDMVARTLGVKPAARDYRSSFPANYKALLPDRARHYRVDVLEASVDQDPVIWVNGDKFELSAEAAGHAQRLQLAWNGLCMQLDRWHRGTEANDPEVSARPPRQIIMRALIQLDQAWANFEHKYITELIDIESKAKRLIVQAIKQELQLQQLERGTEEAGWYSLLSSARYRAEQRSLVELISLLNSVANISRKGRDDLTSDILESAFEVLHRCDASEFGKGGGSSGCAQSSHKASVILAQDIIDSYKAMRRYLQRVSRCVERVDPHLCNNDGLVARLADWEESWEVGAHYLLPKAMRNAVCDLVEQLKAAQLVAPALTSMCQDCDVELFMVLPRLIMLSFVAEPMAQCREVIASLMPHCFKASALDGLCEKLSSLVHDFKTLVQAMSSLCPVSKQLPEAFAREVLVKRAVAGNTNSGAPYGTFSSGMQAAARPALEGFMRDLEFWSVELQRHCPEDWNQFCSVIVDKLGCEHQRKLRTERFQV